MIPTALPSRKIRFLIFCLLLGVAIGLQLATQRLQPTPVQSVPEEIPEGFVRVAKVIDGDTIELMDGSRVRYIGIDTPETVHPTKGVQCYGPEASTFNKVLLQDGLVRLERDISNTDTYGRLLRYVFTLDGTFVNLELVARGYAEARAYPPDIAYTEQFRNAQEAAQEAGLGRWSACPAGS